MLCSMLAASARCVALVIMLIEVKHLFKSATWHRLYKLRSNLSSLLIEKYCATSSNQHLDIFKCACVLLDQVTDEHQRNL